jgi:hypothetical protein
VFTCYILLLMITVWPSAVVVVMQVDIHELYLILIKRVMDMNSKVIFVCLPI